MTSLESMVTKLASLRLYDFSEGSEINIELSVFAAELDTAFARLDEMTRECFIETAQSWGISEREKFTGKEKVSLSLEKRRELLKTAQYVTGADFRTPGFEEFVRSCGAQDFTYIEAPSVSKINLTINDDLDSGAKKLLEERLDAYCPAHCKMIIRYS